MNRTALLAAVGVTIVGVVLFALYMRRFEAEAAGGEPVEVLMVTADIPLGEPLSIEKLATRSLPEAYVEDRHVLASDQQRILGIRVNTALRANQSLLWTDLATGASERRDLSTLLREGMRALTIRTNPSSSFGGLLRPGDRVDVLLTAQRPGGETRVTVPLQQNVLVLAVGSDTGGPDRADTTEGRRSSGQIDVTLAVTIEQAAMLTHARESGELQLVLRNPDDVEIVNAVPETTDTDLVQPERRRAVNTMRRPQPQGPVRIGSSR